MQTYATHFASTQTVFHVRAGAAPAAMGVSMVQVKKAKNGLVPFMNDNNEAVDQMPYYVHLTYIPRDTHKGLHSMFHQVRPTLGAAEIQ